MSGTTRQAGTPAYRVPIARLRAMGDEMVSRQGREALGMAVIAGSEAMRLLLRRSGALLVRRSGHQ